LGTNKTSKNTNFLPQFEKKEVIWWNFAKGKKNSAFCDVKTIWHLFLTKIASLGVEFTLGFSFGPKKIVQVFFGVVTTIKFI
jgi:hypothetical protein